jgi:hypothetical protein
MIFSYAYMYSYVYVCAHAVSWDSGRGGAFLVQ